MNVPNEIINIDKLDSPAIVQPSRYHQGTYLRNAILYALIYIALSAVIAFVFNIIIIPGITRIESVVIPVMAYLLSGILFTGFLYTALSSLSKLSLNGGLLYSVIVSAGVFSAILIIDLNKEQKTISVITCLFYTCLFLLPYTIHQNWIFFKNLSVINAKKIWYLPEQSSQVRTATVFLNSIRIKIKIAPTQGTAERIYETTVPGRLSIGNMFSNFINDEEKNTGELFELKDEEDHNYGWQFLTPSFLGISKRPVDADVSLNDNNIKANSVIFARRIQSRPENQNQLSA